MGLLYFLYGISSYAIFFATFLYLVGFVANVVVPKSIDSGIAGPPFAALAINVILIAVFGAQHSIMARPWFKRWWTSFVPHPIERATYILLTSLALLLLYWQWRPMTVPVWHVQNGAGRALLFAAMASGFGIVLASTFLIDHFDLFGLRQVFLRLRNIEYSHHAFMTPGWYKLVRHPLYLGFLIAFWSTPDMTQGHAVFAIGMSVYIFAAIPHEERDLTDHFGEDYRNYKKRTPMIVPLPRGRE